MNNFEKMNLLAKYIGSIEGKNQETLMNLIVDNFDRFIQAPGALKSHQPWEGGFLDHLLDMITIGEAIYGLADVPFSWGDLVFVILMHDIEKPFRYIEPAMPCVGASNKQIYAWIGEKYNFDFSPMHINALTYAHGENEHYIPHERVMNELAGYLHACDVISARSHFDKKFNL